MKTTLKNFEKLIEMKYIIGILFILSAWRVNSIGQQNIYSDWPQNIIEKANTAKDVAYLNDKEKEIILLFNLARTDGKKFAETICQTYLDSNKIDQQDKYVKSLLKDLQKTSNLKPFKPQKDLFEIAKSHAIKSGKTGYVGHRNFNKRYDDALQKYRTVGENCDYGNSEPLDIVMNLLIDQGVESLGHRKNILNPEFINIGLSIQPHKEYRVNCVISFGG